MRVCYITDSYPPNIGGAEIAIQKIVEGAAENNIDVFVITSQARENFSFNSKIPESAILRIKTPRALQRFWFLILSFFAIIKKCKDADILHGTSYGGVLQTFIAAKLLRKSCVVTIHEFMGRKWNKFASNFISAYFFRVSEKIFASLSFDRFIAVSNYTKKRLIEAGVTESKITVITNGESDTDLCKLKTKHEVRKELNIPDDKFVFAAFGRTGLTKGLDYVVDAIPEVLDKIPNATFILILSFGDKKIWKRITNKIENLDCERILFYSSLERSRMLDYLNSSDAIIIPSLSEGFGFTTLEACMLNKIVIATNVGAIPEVISGKHILIEPASSEAILNGCINSVSGKYKNEPRKEFNWELSVNKYIKVYQEVLHLH